MFYACSAVPEILRYGLLAMNFLVWNKLHCEKRPLVFTKFKTYLYLKNLGTLEQTLLIKHLTWNNLEQNRNKTWNNSMAYYTHQPHIIYDYHCSRLREWLNKLLDHATTQQRRRRHRTGINVASDIIKRCVQPPQATQAPARYITGFKNLGQKKGGPKASLVIT